MKTNYTPKINHIFTKLMRKVCSDNTPLNTEFIWFNKYKVTMQSGCRDFTAVYVTNLETNRIMAEFDIDFALTKLTILTTYNEDKEDFSIADSLIKSFGDIYRTSYITIDDTDIWKEEYEFYMEAILDEEEYIPEYIEEASNFCKFCETRQSWITEFCNLVK